jgi:hypothetical protein
MKINTFLFFVINILISTLLYSQPGTYPGFNTSLSCNRNAVCEPGWCNPRRSTVLMTNGGIVLGSGVLVNNTNNDFTPYILTSFRLIDADNDGIISESEKNALLYRHFVFNYFSPDCNPTTIPLHGVNDYMIGATFICGEKCNGANNRGYALLRLNQPIPSEFGAYYTGWNLQTVTTGIYGKIRPSASYGGASIHYPNGDVKKIAFYDNRDNLGYGRVHEVDSEGCPHWVVEWEKNGTGFPVKSQAEFEFPTGSPLFNGNKQLIGVHFKNNNRKELLEQCKKPPTSYYEALHVIWDKNTTNGTLKQFLDPKNTGTTNYPGAERCVNSHVFIGRTTLHTDHYAGLYTAYRSITASLGTTIQPYTEVTFQAGTKIELLPGFTAETNSHFTAEIKICGNYCGGGVGKFNQENDLYSHNTPDSSSIDTQTPEHTLIPEELAEKDTVAIFPNPAQDKINIFYSCSQSSYASIVIKNSYGVIVKTVLDQALVHLGEHLFEVSTAELHSGVYYVVFRNMHGYKYQKIIILK